MRRLLTVAVSVIVLMTASPASAGLKVCAGDPYFEVHRVKNVSCAKARKVIKAFLSEERTSGFTCRAKDTPSVFVVCRKGGDKKIEYESE